MCPPCGWRSGTSPAAPAADLVAGLVSEARVGTVVCDGWDARLVGARPLHPEARVGTVVCDGWDARPGERSLEAIG